MKLGKILLTGFISILAMTVSSSSRCDDTDLFLVNPLVPSQLPNVLIVLDNTANWNTPFVAEKAALVSTVQGLKNDIFNVGLMMFTESGGANKGPDGGYMRYAVRQMNSTHKAELATLVNGLDKLNDKSNNGKSGLTMYEAYLYYAGLASYAGGPAGNPSNGKVKSDAGAFSSGATYHSPITDGCQKNFIIYISNGPVQDNATDTNTASNFLAAIGGSTTLIPLNPNGSQSNMSDEYARFFANNDVYSGLVGAQNVITYTVDVLPGSTGQGPGWTALLKSMASQGKGRYFAVTGGDTGAAIADALNKIFEEVQAINSVFASSTLPVSVSVRGNYLNQVYMGVFRPDANSSPRWSGNLKLYQLAANTSTTPATVFLADKLGAAVENTASGFIIPTAQSFWTTSSTFWNASYYPAAQGSGGISDLPDGPLVEKGGAAQRLRTVYAASQATRSLYTCTTGCAANSLLSGTPFSTSNTNITIAGAADTTEQNNIISWIRGANNKGDDNPNLQTTSIRGYVHGDVLHSRPAVINYNRTSGDRDIVIYYGGNDAIFHAVKGGQDDADGYEKWGFVMPEHFGQLKRLRDNTPLIGTANPKPYFADGPVGTYQLDSDNDGKLIAANGDKVHLFIGMRRGGRFIYALDVSDPDNPKFLWKKSNADTGYTEMGQTWSEPKVATIRAHTGPVLIFGLGYDATANDAAPGTTPAPTVTMGRGVMIADAATGAPIWQAGPAPSGAASNKVVAGMTFSIAADMTVLDTNGDGKADRIYAADTGGNVWRINIDDANPDNWTVSKLAAVGGADANARKFLYAPDVVYASGYDAVLIGSGDREHPFDTTIQNRYYMFKDSHALNATRGTPITETAMYDATANLIQVGTADQQAAAATSLASSSGWYVTLSPGEKVVGGSTTVGGAVFFSTNTPSSTLPSGSCANTLGEARNYMLNYTNASFNFNFETYNAPIPPPTARFEVQAGGGYPPSPVPVVVEIGGKRYEAVITGPKVKMPPSPTLDIRRRTYWYKPKG